MVYNPRVMVLCRVEPVGEVIDIVEFVELE